MREGAYFGTRLFGIFYKSNRSHFSLAASFQLLMENWAEGHVSKK